MKATIWVAGGEGHVFVPLYPFFLYHTIRCSCWEGRQGCGAVCFCIVVMVSPRKPPQEGEVYFGLLLNKISVECDGKGKEKPRGDSWTRK